VHGPGVVRDEQSRPGEQREQLVERHAAGEIAEVALRRLDDLARQRSFRRPAGDRHHGSVLVHEAAAQETEAPRGPAPAREIVARAGMEDDQRPRADVVQAAPAVHALGRIARHLQAARPVDPLPQAHRPGQCQEALAAVAPVVVRNRDVGEPRAPLALGVEGHGLLWSRQEEQHLRRAHELLEVQREVDAQAAQNRQGAEQIQQRRRGRSLADAEHPVGHGAVDRLVIRQRDDREARSRVALTEAAEDRQQQRGVADPPELHDRDLPDRAQGLVAAEQVADRAQRPKRAQHGPADQAVEELRRREAQVPASTRGRSGECRPPATGSFASSASSSSVPPRSRASARFISVWQFQ
jgi:hypothetical protein